MGRRRFARRLVSTLVIAAWLTQASPALAQAADVALAEALFREGKALMKAGQYDDGCPKLAESNRVDPATGTLLALALCHELQGKTATAWGEYNEVVAIAARQGNAQRGRVAREQIAKLEPRLSRLTVAVGAEVANLPGLRVMLDGTPLGEPTWGSAVPVDPGDHVVQVTAEHKKTLSRSVRVGAHGPPQTVTIPALEEDAGSASMPSPLPAPLPGASPPLAGTVGDAQPGSAPGEHGAEVHSRPIPLPAYVAAGIGLASMASFTYFGLTGRAEYFDYKSSCGPDCSRSEVAPTHTRLIVADASLGASVLALGVAAYLFFTRPHASYVTAPATAGALSVDAGFFPHTAGARVGLAF
jgi:hypothetical protein